MPLLRLYERMSDDGRLTSYQVNIRRTGFPTQSKSFDDLEEADRFVRQVLADQDRGHRVDRLAAHRVTVGDVINDAISTLRKGARDVKGARTELHRLTKFRRDQTLLCSTAMADLEETMLEDWLADRLEEVAPSTALRDIRLLKPIFKQAARRLDLRYLPMDFLRNPRVMDERVRRIDPAEEGLLFAELKKCEEPLVLEAAEFVIGTGCRRSELLRLEGTWSLLLRRAAATAGPTKPPSLDEAPKRHRPEGALLPIGALRGLAGKLVTRLAFGWAG